MVSHGLAVAALYAVTGLVYARVPYRLLEDLGGLGRILPRLALCFTFAVCASLSLPGTAGFVGEFLIFTGTYGSHHGWWLVPALLGALVSGLCLLKACHSVFWRKTYPGDHNTLKDISGVERLALLLLMGAILVLGLYPQLFMKHIDPATTTFLTELMPLVTGGLR